MSIVYGDLTKHLQKRHKHIFYRFCSKKGISRNCRDCSKGDGVISAFMTSLLQLRECQTSALSSPSSIGESLLRSSFADRMHHAIYKLTSKVKKRV